MKLYGYWRSSATFRVRIALALKGIDYDYEPINLLKGEQSSESYRRINPQGLVPALVIDDGHVLTQSLAIIEYLEEAFPASPLLPHDPVARAKARAVASVIACEAQTMMNIGVQSYLKNDIGLDAEGVGRWLNARTGGAMRTADALIAGEPGPYAFGEAPGLADAFIVPQMFGAMRFGVDTSDMPRLTSVYETCLGHPAFEAAHPMNQPDAVKD